MNKLPVIIFCQNNQYAISIPAHKQLAGKVSDRALGYGFPGIQTAMIRLKCTVLLRKRGRELLEEKDQR